MSDGLRRRLAQAAVLDGARVPTTLDEAGVEIHAACTRLRRSGLMEGGYEAVDEMVRSWPIEVRPPDVDLVKAFTYSFGKVTEQQSDAGIELRSHEDRERDRRIPKPMIISGLAPEGGICAFIALPGVGKTLMGLELARCVASGSAFAGRAVTQGVVLYACADAPASTERRMLAMPMSAAGHIFTVTEMPMLPGSVGALRAAVELLNANAELPVRMVVLDTWDSSREHSSGGWADQDGGTEGIMRGLRGMASDLKLAVLIIHHATRHDEGRARGSLVFDARCDWMAVVEKGGPGVVLRTTKARDGECGLVGGWTIATVKVEDVGVPTLVSAPLDQAEVTGADDQRRMLEAAQGMADNGQKPTAKALVKVLSMGMGKMQGTAERLRAKGLLSSGGYSPTEEGRRWLAAECPSSPERTVPPERGSGIYEERTQKTRHSAGTHPANSAAPFHRSTPIGVEQGGTQDDECEVLDPEDFFLNAPTVPAL